MKFSLLIIFLLVYVRMVVVLMLKCMVEVWSLRVNWLLLGLFLMLLNVSRLKWNLSSIVIIWRNWLRCVLLIC